MAVTPVRSGSDGRVIELREHGSSLEHLNPDQGHALTLVAPDVLDVRPTRRPGEYRLRAGGVVGTLVVGGVTVRIRPKVRLSTLLYLLSGSLDAVTWFDQEYGRSPTDDLASVLYAMYARLLGRSLQAGLVHSYRHRHDRVTRVQGRLDFGELARTPHRPPVPAPCDFDEFTADTDLNRFLKAAAVDAAVDRNLPRGIRRLLRGHLAAMHEVSDGAPRPESLDGHVFTRLDRHYATPARLARLILARRFIAEHAGVAHGDTFLVDMSTVFEDHVAEGLRRRMPDDVTVEREPRTAFDRDRHLVMKPDIVFFRNRRPVHVADVKYKLLEGGRGRSGDLYQAHAYSTVMGLPASSLLYAEREGGPPPKHVEVIGSGTAIETHELALRGTPTDVEAALDRLAEALRPHLRSPADRSRTTRGVQVPIGA
nr:McrC family protein [Salsipaludibacter albus]